MSSSPRLSLPYILTNQAQKEVTHNDALNNLDVWVQPVAQSADLVAPPGSPAEGAVWLVAAGATDAWAGKAGMLAQWIGGVWQFHAPIDGAVIRIADQGLTARYEAGAGWIIGDVTAARVLIDGQAVLGARQPAIADPSGGTVIDIEARDAIVAILDSLRQHGLIGS